MYAGGRVADDEVAHVGDVQAAVAFDCAVAAPSVAADRYAAGDHAFGDVEEVEGVKVFMSAAAEVVAGDGVVLAIVAIDAVVAVLHLAVFDRDVAVGAGILNANAHAGNDATERPGSIHIVHGEVGHVF